MQKGDDGIKETLALELNSGAFEVKNSSDVHEIVQSLRADN